MTKILSLAIHSAGVLLGLCLATATARAGHEKGNGGYVVVCGPASAELLDFYEARTLHGLQRDLGSATAEVDGKIEFVLKRLERLNPTRAARYRTWAADFWKEARGLRGSDLGDIGDSDHIAVPAGCQAHPAVNQRVPLFPEDSRYVVNLDLWDRLDADSRAGLILHELVYRELLQQETSVRVRYFNSYLTSSRLASMGASDYLTLAQAVGLPDLDLLGLSVDLSRPVVREGAGGGILSAVPLPGSPLVVLGQSVRAPNYRPEDMAPVEFHPDGGLKRVAFDGRIRWDWRGLRLILSSLVRGGMEFHPDGRPARACLEEAAPDRLFRFPDGELRLGVSSLAAAPETPKPSLIEWGADGSLRYIEHARGRIRVGGAWLEVHEAGIGLGAIHPDGLGGLEFHPGGALALAYLEHEAEVRTGGGIVLQAAPAALRFHPDGSVAELKLARAARLPGAADAGVRPYPAGGRLRLDPRGRVIRDY